MNTLAKAALWLLAVVLAALALLLGAYFAQGSLEQFPTDEQQGKARIASGLGFILCVLLEAAVVAMLLRTRRARSRKSSADVLLLALSMLLLGAPRLLAAADPIDKKAGCKTNPAVVTPCFKIQGRAVLANGTPSLRILHLGTKRILGVLPAEDEIVPPCLRDALSGDSTATGEILVCPFTPEKPGHMRMVCVQEVGRLTVRRWDEGKKGHVETTVPGCALPDPR